MVCVRVCVYHPPCVLPGVVGAMVAAGGGQVVVISSLQGKVGVPLRTSCESTLHYCVTQPMMKYY